MCITRWYGGWGGWGVVWRRVNIHSSALTFSGEETPWQVGGWRGGKGGGASISLVAWGRDGGGGTFLGEWGKDKCAAPWVSPPYGTQHLLHPPPTPFIYSPFPSPLHSKCGCVVAPLWGAIPSPTKYPSNHQPTN